MKGNSLTAFALAVGTLMVSTLLFAHHGNAEFSTEKAVTVKATVTLWFWANPHCFLGFDVKDDNGQMTHWIAETGPPPDFINSGWGKQSFKPGDQVTVTSRSIRNQENGMKLPHFSWSRRKHTTQANWPETPVV